MSSPRPWSACNEEDVLRRPLALTLLAALVAATAPLAGAAAQAPGPSPAAGAVPPGLGIRLLEAPTNRRDDPRARTTVVDHVAPGATFTRRLQATNGTDAPARVVFYARSAEVRDGDLVVDDAGSGLVSDAVTVAPREATVPPGGTLDAVATFAVPAGATEDEYYGVLFVERPADPGSGLRVASRAGIAVYLSVGPGGEPRSDFVIKTLTAERDDQGRPVVVASVQNQGGRALSITGDLRLSDGPGGLSAGPFPADLGTVLGIGQTAPVRVVLDERLPDGPWRARLDLRSGLVERAAEATITFPADAGESAAPVEAEELALAEDPDVLIPVAGGLIGLVALLLLLLLWRRRRKDDDEDAEEQVPQAAG